MGLAGVRTSNNMEFYNAKRPLAVVYFDVDYERNPKGEKESSASCLISTFFSTQAATIGETGTVVLVCIVPDVIGGCGPMVQSH